MITEVMIHPKCFDKSTEISDLSRVIYDIKFSKNIFIIGFQGDDIKKYIVQNYIDNKKTIIIQTRHCLFSIIKKI